MHWEANEREDVFPRLLFKGRFKGTEKKSLFYVYIFWAPKYLSFTCLKTLCCQKRGVRAMLSGGFVLLSIEQDNLFQLQNDLVP